MGNSFEQMKLKLSNLKIEKLLNYFAIALMLYVLYELINALRGHSLETVSLGVAVIISFNFIVISQLININNSIKDISKEIAVGFEKLSSSKKR